MSTRDPGRRCRCTGSTVFVTHDAARRGLRRGPWSPRPRGGAVMSSRAVWCHRSVGGPGVQIGSPHDVYASPIDAEVAVFVGEANLIPVIRDATTTVFVTHDRDEAFAVADTPWGRAPIDAARAVRGRGEPEAPAGPGAAEGGVWVVRPEALRCVDPATAAGSDSLGPTVAGRVREVELYGSTTVSVVDGECRVGERRGGGHSGGGLDGCSRRTAGVGARARCAAAAAGRRGRRRVRRRSGLDRPDRRASDGLGRADANHVA